MKTLFLSLVFLGCLSLYAQTPTENYIKTTTYLAPSSGPITENDTIVTVQYFDGLGRLKQTVQVGAGGQGQDIITPVVYDAFGRQTKAYLPYAAASQNGNIHTDPIAELETFYNVPKYGNTPNPYSEKVLEASPLGRVLEQGAPGLPWAADPLSDNDHTIKFSYSTNTTNEVRLYRVITHVDKYASHMGTHIPDLQADGFYLPGRLYKSVIKDENWQPEDGSLHTAEEFKDFQGRVVLKRTYALVEDVVRPHDTYYIYDDYGNLSYIIPPKVNTEDGISEEELNELCYQYVYDHRNRLVEKKVPGKGWEYIVYNKGNHPVFTQDEQLRTNGYWTFIKYDTFGRIVYSGLYSQSIRRKDLQLQMEAQDLLYERPTAEAQNIASKSIYYTNAVFPTTKLILHTMVYYDNYRFTDEEAPEAVYGIVPTTRTKTLTTGSRTRVLGSNHWVNTVNYYDEKARLIYSETHNEATQITESQRHQLDFVGKVLETTTVHVKAGEEPVTSIEEFSYDRMGRLLTHTRQTNEQAEETLAAHSYDALGQLVQKNIGNTAEAPLQTVDYTYNIRGWLTGINNVNALNNDLFAFNIRYDDPTSGTALYNGNISQTYWRTANTDSSIKHYTYSYDPLNRITKAIDNTGHYTLSGIRYDKNGNILSLQRQGHLNGEANVFGLMDNLSYIYDNTNQLLKVEDMANDKYGFKDDALNIADDSNDYTYDANGNMTSDANKGITTIRYNHLNLPTEIVFNNDPNQKISYVYTADGGKLQKIVNDHGTITTTDYAGDYIYENGTLKFINHAEGYLQPDGEGGFAYVYQYKDHLGNVRLSYSDTNGDGVVDVNEIIEESNYYPFGLKHKGYNAVVNGQQNKFLTYNGKEFEQSLGLNIMEMDFRQYDATIGRFSGMDRLAELGVSITPYRFGFNNPILFSDPTGLYEVDKDGTYIITDEKEVSAFIDILSDNQHSSVEDLISKVIASEDLVEELPGITVTSTGDSYLTEAVNEVASQVQSSLNRISKRKTEWNIDLRGDGKDILHQEVGVRGIGISFEMAFPTNIPGTSAYGFGIDFGVLGDINGNAPYFTAKVAREPGVALGAQLEFFQALKTSSNPNDYITRSYLRGLGYESGFGIGPVGGSYGTSDAAKYNRISSYRVYTGSVGLGIDLGYVNWLTKTYVPKK